MQAETDCSDRQRRTEIAKVTEANRGSQTQPETVKDSQKQTEDSERWTETDMETVRGRRGRIGTTEEWQIQAEAEPAKRRTAADKTTKGGHRQPKHAEADSDTHIKVNRGGQMQTERQQDADRDG